ncbi:metallophosphoesterase [Methanosarcina barkeri]|nr:metallophosphoesterase family protein [Methanosarcina barkeri]
MRILLIADIHANYEALETVLEIPYDRAICLGDIVDYGRIRTNVLIFCA